MKCIHFEAATPPIVVFSQSRTETGQWVRKGTFDSKKILIITMKPSYTLERGIECKDVILNRVTTSSRYSAQTISLAVNGSYDRVNNALLYRLGTESNAYAKAVLIALHSLGSPNHCPLTLQAIHERSMSTLNWPHLSFVHMVRVPQGSNRCHEGIHTASPVGVRLFALLCRALSAYMCLADPKWGS